MRFKLFIYNSGYLLSLAPLEYLRFYPVLVAVGLFLILLSLLLACAGAGVICFMICFVFVASLLGL